MDTTWKNQLYFGDNLEILRDYIPPESVDLVYLDPPFNSQATYNVLFKEANGTQAAAQIKAFEDFWHWEDAAPAYHEVVTSGPPQVAKLLSALHDFLGHNDMMAYLAMMAIRLVELHRVLKPTGSLYLHCDPTASHYLKLLLDSIFGKKNLQNEIVWQKVQVSKAQSGHFGKVHDLLFFYSKSDRWTFNQQLTKYDERYIKSHYGLTDPNTGRRYGTWDLTQTGDGPPRRFGDRAIAPPEGKHWIYTQERIDKATAEGRIHFTTSGMPRLKRYLDEAAGNAVGDIWTDVPPINAMARERLGYPTQKPEALLERIIKASSHEGDLVLDPFCGCGTTIAVAERLHRRWIGIDITHLAIALMKTRLDHAFGPDLSDYDVIGEPKDLESARALFREDPYQFQYWALSLVKARPAGEPKKGADQGIDGWQYFFDDDSGTAKRIVISVKGGGVTRHMVGDLIAVTAREKAELGVFITLEPPTRPMLQEAADTGMYQPPGLQQPVAKIQILTIEDLLAGKTIQLPPTANATFKRAPRQFKAKPQGPQLEIGEE